MGRPLLPGARAWPLAAGRALRRPGRRHALLWRGARGPVPRVLLAAGMEPPLIPHPPLPQGEELARRSLAGPSECTVACRPHPSWLAGLYGLPQARLGRSSALPCGGEGVGPLPGCAVGWHRGRPDLVATSVAPSATAKLAWPHGRALRPGLPGAHRAGLASDGLDGSRVRHRLLALCALRATDQRPALSR